MALIGRVLLWGEICGNTLRMRDRIVRGPLVSVSLVVMEHSRSSSEDFDKIGESGFK